MLYVLQIHQDSAANTAHVSSVSEFLLAQTCLSFAILDASKKKFKKVTEESHLDDITTGMTYLHILSRIHMYIQCSSNLSIYRLSNLFGFLAFQLPISHKGYCKTTFNCNIFISRFTSDKLIRDD